MNGAHAGELQYDAPRSEAAVYEAPAVLRLLWADPQYVPEHLAMGDCLPRRSGHRRREMGQRRDRPDRPLLAGRTRLGGLPLVGRRRARKLVAS
jgi:hypothetical protein